MRKVRGIHPFNTTTSSSFQISNGGVKNFQPNLLFLKNLVVMNDLILIIVGDVNFALENHNVKIGPIIDAFTKHIEPEIPTNYTRDSAVDWVVSKFDTPLLASVLADIRNEDLLAFRTEEEKRAAAASKKKATSEYYFYPDDEYICNYTASFEAFQTEKMHKYGVPTLIPLKQSKSATTAATPAKRTASSSRGPASSGRHAKRRNIDEETADSGSSDEGISGMSGEESYESDAQEPVSADAGPAELNAEPAEPNAGDEPLDCLSWDDALDVFGMSAAEGE